MRWALGAAQTQKTKKSGVSARGCADGAQGTGSLSSERSLPILDADPADDGLDRDLLYIISYHIISYHIISYHIIICIYIYIYREREREMCTHIIIGLDRDGLQLRGRQLPHEEGHPVLFATAKYNTL